MESIVKSTVGGKDRRFVTVAACTAVGIVVFVTTLYRGLAAQQSCASAIGPLWACSSPQYLFPNGLFYSTQCDLASVRELKCEGAGLVELPKLETFENLERIDVRNNKRLRKLPLLLVNRTDLHIEAAGSPAHAIVDWSDDDPGSVARTLANPPPLVTRSPSKAAPLMRERLLPPMTRSSTAAHCSCDTSVTIGSLPLRRSFV